MADQIIVTLLDLDAKIVRALHDRFDKRTVESRLETSQRSIFDQAVLAHLDDLVGTLEQAGFAKARTTGPQRRKINKKTWGRLGEQADRLDVSRQALLRACLRKFLR